MSDVDIPVVEVSEIRDGVEWFRHGDEEGCQCARCGSSCTFEDCYECAGDGYFEGYDEEDEDVFLDCKTCGGNGGWHVCLSGAAWCLAHPIAGREEQEGAG